MRGAAIAGVAALMLVTAGCDSKSDRSDTAEAKQDLHSAGKDVDAGVDQLGDAASAAADGADREGKALLRKGRRIAADAADEVSADASDAARDLRHH